MKSSRLLPCAVVLALSLVAFPSCSKKSSEPVTLTVWGRDLPDDGADHAYIKAVVTGFKAAHPEINLEYVPLGDPGLMDKTKIAMASSEGPDIFQSWGGSVMGGYADADRLLDMTTELKEVATSDAARNAMSWKGKTYGVAPFFAIAGLFVNEGLFAANGLKVPATIEEMEKVCDVFLAKGIQPFACGAKDKWPPLAMYMYLTNRIGGDVAKQAQARKAAFSDDAFVKAAELYQSWAKKGYFGKAPLGEDYTDAQQLMSTGKAAMIVTGSWMCSNFSDPKFTDQKVGFYAFPLLPGGMGSAADVMGMPDIAFAVTKRAADKKEAVMTFLKYAMSPEVCAAEPGRICSVPGVKAPSPLTGMASAVMSTAATVQFWWDQDLPPSVTSPLNDTIQTFFLKDMKVSERLAKYEALVTENMGPVAR